MPKVHSEILYTREDGLSIHSDTCPSGCDFESIDKEYRKYAHELLDEWFDKSRGTGIFYIREEGFRNYGNDGVQEQNFYVDNSK